MEPSLSFNIFGNKYDLDAYHDGFPIDEEDKREASAVATSSK